MVQKALQLPPSEQVFSAGSPVFLRLQLVNASTGVTLSINTYWLSANPDVLDWNASTFYLTPCSSYTDFRPDLCSLPAVDVAAAVTSVTLGADGYATVAVTATNKSPGVAFSVRWRLRGLDILPVLWSDNYVTLLGGESLNVTARVLADAVADGTPTLVTETYNALVTCQ